MAAMRWACRLSRRFAAMPSAFHSTATGTASISWPSMMTVSALSKIGSEDFLPRICRATLLLLDARRRPQLPRQPNGFARGFANGRSAHSWSRSRWSASMSKPCRITGQKRRPPVESFRYAYAGGSSVPIIDELPRNAGGETRVCQPNGAVDLAGQEGFQLLRFASAVAVHFRRFDDPFPVVRSITCLGVHAERQIVRKPGLVRTQRPQGTRFGVP